MFCAKKVTKLPDLTVLYYFMQIIILTACLQKTGGFALCDISYMYPVVAQVTTDHSDQVYLLTFGFVSMNLPSNP
jgi:hypothetical protein